MTGTDALTVLLYGGDRTLRLDLARLLRDEGLRVLLASSPAEAAKALASGGVRAIGALGPLPTLPGSSAAGSPPVVNTVDAGMDGATHERGETDALAWRERIRRALADSPDQPTSSA